MKKRLLVFLVVLLLIPVVYATEYSVGPGKTYETITACLNAINNTANGCSLNVANTVYTIDRGRTYDVSGLLSAPIRLNATSQTLDCNGSTIKGNPIGGYVILVMASNSTVKNCKLISGSSGIFIDTTYSNNNRFYNATTNITSPITYNKIFNNTFINNMYGIDLFTDKSGSNRIGENNKFFDNLFYNSSIFFDGGGFNNTIIDGNTLYNGVIGFNGAYINVTNNMVILPPTNETEGGQEGIGTGESYFSLIEGNTVINARDGIGMEYGNSNTIKQNNLINSTWYGIGSGDGGNDLITLNTIIGSRKDGIWTGMYTSNNVLSFNTITDSTKFGMDIEGQNNTISGNTFTSNGGSINCSYYSSSYPRNWNSINWSDTPFGDGMLLLFATSPYAALLNSESNSVGSVVTGASNLNLALFDVPADVPAFGNENLTAIFSDAVATSCPGLEAFLASHSVSGTHCAYFEPDAWIANGVCRSYTNSINSTTTTVSGFYTPSLVSAINPINGAIYIANTGNSLTSNTFNSNTVSITVVSGVYNTILGGIINLNNDLSLYIPGDLNVVINALIIGSASGNYYLYKGSNELNISNSKGGISWRISHLALNANLGTNLLLGSGFISLNTAALGGLNQKANVTITGVACDNFKLWYSSGFYSSLVDIKANGVIVATQANIGGDCTDDLICKNVQCSNSILTFEAQHFDSFGAEGEGATGNVSINLTGETSIMVKYNIAYGEGRVDPDKSSAVLDSSLANAINGTWTYSPQYMYIENDGTVNVSVNITSSKTAASFIGGTNPEFKSKGIKTENGSCAGTFQTSYFDVLNTSRSICSLLQFGNSFDTFNVSTRLLIPSDAPTGKKESVLTFTAKKV